MTATPSILKPVGPSPRARRTGFALIATISMMALITVLAMGLLALSVAATRQQSSIRESLVAQSNAKLALALALGDLQKFAGPDQRTTATADMAGDANGERLASGKQPVNDKSLENVAKGLSPVQPGTRYWTGVWTNSRPADEIYAKTPSPTLVQWLVSGNGGKTALPAVTPASPSVAVKNDGSTGSGKDAVVLVGRGSVGPASAQENLDRHVSAPIVNIAQPVGATTKALGRYAWWVGDEGVKSRINLRPPDGANTIATYQHLAAQRRGWEIVNGFQSYPSYGSPQQGLLDRLVTLPETALLDPTLSAPVGATSPLQAAFHSACTDSRGVIADTLRGGLRLDLSSYMANISQKPVPGVPNSPTSGGNIIPLVGGTDYSPKLGPKWERLKAWHDLGKAAAGGTLSVKGSSSPNDLTIAPIILDLRLLMGARLVSASDTSYRILPCGKLAVALANPYPYPLEWRGALELQIVNDTPLNNRPSCIWNATGQPAFLDYGQQPAVFFNVTFRIPSDTIPPGEARAYTMGAPFFRPYTTNPITIDLGPFGSSDPSNFTNSIQMEHTGVNDVEKLLDVRESWTTSQATAELRLAGSSPYLRRLDAFELDNGFFASVQRKVNGTIAKTMTAPFAMHLYSFQISQPGGDYSAVMPDSSLLGTRSSTVRTFMDFNLQAERFIKPVTSYDPPPYFMESSDSLATLPFNVPGGETGNGFTRNLAVSPLSWGRALGFGPKKTVLFSPPETLVSLGQIQHYDLTCDDLSKSVSQQPGNAVGNSYATPFVKRQMVMQSRDNYVVTGLGGGADQTSSHIAHNYFDLSYLLNTALYDSFFVSSIPPSQGAGPPQPVNRKIVKVDPSDTSGELRDGMRAASRLMIDGAFNVNSTDKNAWKALLASNKKLQHPGGGDPAGALVARSLEQPSPCKTPPSGTDDDAFSGYRRLTDEQIDILADEIVRQVRQRGPFVSLSHFVNRALVDLKKDPALGRSGALQSALDISGTNISPDGRKCAYSGSGFDVAQDRLNLQSEGGAPKADLFGPQTNGSRGATYGGTTADGDPVWASTSKDLNFGSMASMLADRPMLTDSNLRTEQGFRSTGIPGWVTQADLLQVIGPSLSSRSDTFRVRTYGEAISPTTGKITARAWCEAVVQRMPDYLASNQNAPTDRDTALSPVNKLFGREFRIVSFRWLSPDEI